MSKFTPGDMVMVVKDYSDIERCGHGSKIGKIYTVIAIQYLYNVVTGRHALVNVVDGRGDSNIPGSVMGFEDEYLKRIDDNDDGRCYEKTEWDDAIYKPRELVRIEND